MAAYGVLFDENGCVNRRRSLFLGWGRGVGKTHFARQIWWLLIAAFEHKLRTDALDPFRGVRITSLAPTLKQWKDINWGGIEEELSPRGKWGFLRARLDRQSGQIWFPGGSVVKPFPASEYNARTARGLRTDVLDAEEYDDIDASVYDGVAIPWLSEPWSLAIELLRGTPTRGRHGLWYRALEAGRLSEKLRNGTISDDDVLAHPRFEAVLDILDSIPAEEWPASLPKDPRAATLEVARSQYASHATYRDAPETVSLIAVARARSSMPEATFNREFNADPDAGEGLVYPFDAEFHVREAPKIEHWNTAFREFHVGMDHGWVDPGVLLLIGIQGHGEDAVAWVLKEEYESEVPLHVWLDRCEKWNFAKFWPDTSVPAQASGLKARGISVGEVDKSVLSGIGRVAEFLFKRTSESGAQWARMYVAPECKNTIREFGLYRRKKLPDGTFDETPTDKNDHSMDALRYAIYGRFGRAQSFRHEVSGR